MPNSDAFTAAATEAAINIGNAISTGNLNRKNRKFAKEMYETQRADALDFWNRQNEYNLPANQMQRFKDAGLNPTLVYGQTNEGGTLSNPQFNMPDQQAFQVRNNPALTYLTLSTDLEMKDAQTDNLRAQNNAILTETALKAAMIDSVNAGTRRKVFDLDFESSLVETSAEARRELVRQMKANTDVTLRRDLRETLMNSSNLREANERIQSMIQSRAAQKLDMARTDADRQRIQVETQRLKKSIDIMMKEGVIKDLDVDLARAGVRASDPIWYRSIGLVLNQLIEQFFGE